MATERSSPDSHKEYPDQKRYDLLYYQALLPKVGGIVFDIGCGMGIFTNMMAQKDDVDIIYAVDRFPIAERINKSDKIHYIETDITTGVVFPGLADTIVSTEFIEHIAESELNALLISIKSMLAPGGKFIGSTPIRVVPTTNPYHLKEYTLLELQNKLESVFNTVEVLDIGLGCQVWSVS